MKIGYIWLWGILVTIISGIGLFWYDDKVERKIEIVECYDNEYNEIIGLECEEESFAYLKDTIIMIVIIIIFAVSFVLSAFGALAIPRNFNEEW